MANTATDTKDKINAAKATLANTPAVIEGKVLNGEFAARIESAQPGVFKTGSFGVKIQYGLEGTGVNNRKAYENIVLQYKTGEDTKYGLSSLKRRLMAAGLSSDEINAFTVPSPSDVLEAGNYGDFPTLHGLKVMLSLDSTRTYNGKNVTDIKKVYSR